MRRDIVRPIVIVLVLVGMLAIIFVLINSLVFTGAGGETTYEGRNRETPERESEIEVEVPSEPEHEEGNLEQEETVQFFFETEDFSIELFPAQGFVLPQQYANANEFLANVPEYDILVSREGIPPMQFVLGDHTRWNKITRYEAHVDDFVLQPHHLTFEEIATLVAIAIYEELGINVDGFFGYMHFMGRNFAIDTLDATGDAIWIGYLEDVLYMTGYPSVTIHFEVDAVSGYVLSIHDDIIIIN